MTDIYLIRHGETVCNRENKFAGHYDTELTDTGREQAERTGEFMKSIKLDAVYSSDLVRAYETAEFTAKPQGITVVKTDKLRELAVGIWEGVPYDFVVAAYPEQIKEWRECAVDIRFGGGETMRELNTRILSAVEELAEKSDGKNIAVVTHATPIRLVIGAAKGIPVENSSELGWVSNASVTHVKYDNGAFELITEGYDKHLLGIQTRIAEGV